MELRAPTNARKCRSAKEKENFKGKIKNKGGILSASLIFFTAMIFLFMLAPMLLLFWQERQDEIRRLNWLRNFKKEAEELSGSISRRMNELESRVYNRTDEVQKQFEQIYAQIETAMRNSKEALELGHKIAVDSARRTIPQTPIKIEPLRVVVYQAKDLPKRTKKVKTDELDEKLVADVKEKMKILSQ
jgi:hypothetical protein